MRADLAKNYPVASEEFFQFDHIASSLQSEYSPQLRATIARYLIKQFVPDQFKPFELEEDIRVTCLAWIIRDADEETLQLAKQLGVEISSQYRSSTIQSLWYIVLGQIRKMDGDPEPQQEVAADIQKAHYKPEESNGDIAVYELLPKIFTYAAMHFDCEGAIKYIRKSQTSAGSK